MEQAGLMERLFSAFQMMLAKVKGSLYYAVLFVSVIFAAATGIVGASVTILGIMAAKSMNRSGYDVRLAAGTITAGGTLGILIPPSIMLVVMGPIMEIPVIDLFAAAILPGILLASLYAGYTTIRCMINPKLGPVIPEDMRAASMKDVWIEFFLGLVPPAALVFAALGSILFGFATPTEAAGCGAMGALLLSLANERSKAPIAPQPAASVGVANPNKILPNAANTKAAGGTNPRKNSIHTSFILAALISSGMTGPNLGLIIHLMVV